MARFVTFALVVSTFVSSFSAVAALVAQDKQSSSLTRSKLFLIGGGWDDNYDNGIFYAICDNAPKKFNDAAANSDSPTQIRIAIVTAASSDPDSPPYYKKLFEGKSNAQYHVETEWVPITVNMTYNNRDPAVVAMLDRANVLFFSGGDQSNLLKSFTYFDKVQQALTDSPFLSQARKMFANGDILIAGTSAGTAVEASRRSTMFSGGESWEAVVYGAFPDAAPEAHQSSDIPPSALTYNPYGGFGFFTLGLIDTHFSERGRQGRLVRLADHVKYPLAFGVDENSALFVQSALQADNNVETAELQVFGGAHFFNLTQSLFYQRSSEGSSDDESWRITNVENAYYTQGDRLTISVDHNDGGRKSIRSVQYAAWKTSLWGREADQAPRTSTDIFSSPNDDGGDEDGPRKFPREFVIIAQDLVNSKYGNVSVSTTYEIDPAYVVRMQRTDDGPYKTAAMQGFDPKSKTADGKPNDYISYDYLLVDMFKLGTSF